MLNEREKWIAREAYNEGIDDDRRGDYDPDGLIVSLAPDAPADPRDAEITRLNGLLDEVEHIVQMSDDRVLHWSVPVGALESILDRRKEAGE